MYVTVQLIVIEYGNDGSPKIAIVAY